MTPNSLPSLVLKTLPKIWFTITSPNANIQRRPLRSEAEKRPSGGGPLGP